MQCRALQVSRWHSIKVAPLELAQRCCTHDKWLAGLHRAWQTQLAYYASAALAACGCIVAVLDFLHACAHALVLSLRLTYARLDVGGHAGFLVV
jgi:hypothetical protein